MNTAFPDDPQLTFFTDFADDCAERRAAEAYKRQRDDDAEDYAA
jgi:hypothetical protein